MRKDPAHELQRMLNFLNITADQARFECAIETTNCEDQKETCREAPQGDENLKYYRWRRSFFRILFFSVCMCMSVSASVSVSLSVSFSYLPFVIPFHSGLFLTSLFRSSNEQRSWMLNVTHGLWILLCD